MQNSARIQALKDAGYTVKVAHLRRSGDDPDSGVVLAKHILVAGGHSISARGGVTLVQARDAEDTLVAQGIARCSPRDPFNKRLGLTIALNRLEKTLAQA